MSAEASPVPTPANGPSGRLQEIYRSDGVLGGCRLLSLIKDGERGSVFRAEQVATGREVVVKVPVREYAWGRITTATLEALVLAYVRHPSVVRILGAGQERGLDYLVLESIRGLNLDQLLTGGGALEPAEAASLLESAAGALAAVHRRGVVHCDVKPGNLIRAEGGQVRLIDFGLARFAGSGPWPYGDGVVAASPHYMSPEQAEGVPLDCRTDVYSLGATFYHVLAGVPPFEGDAGEDELERHLEETPRPLRRANLSVPADLARIVDRMMARERGDRFGTMGEARAAVAAWLGGRGTRAA